ncbi:MAG TPA: TetR/AcrR family transcriptional regulator [Candidatus Limnocylindrales bacterium]|nr:TetR/AcrR family transcriptional regulator [Candidatus Limnocylindrales bacterium]
MTARRRATGRLPGWPAESEPSSSAEPLTLDRILEAALRIADAEGLDALSMRRLGSELGAGATSLYWHVRNKDELLDLLVDRVIGEMLAEIEPADGWRAQMGAAARTARRVLVRHRHLAPVFGSRPTFGPNALQAIELVVGQLRAAGFDDLTASLGANAVITWASGYAVFEARDPLGPNASEEERTAYAAAIAETFARLPPERFPNTVSMLPLMSEITADSQFESALGWLLDGLELTLPRGGRGETGATPRG